MGASKYISADQAASTLDVQKSTIYAYVSRGLIRSRARPGTRKREYLRADVQRLRTGARAHRDPRGAVRGALRTDGLPVLRSALSCIEDGRLYYRGKEVVELARTCGFEDVVGLLWGAWPSEGLPVRRRRGVREVALLTRMQQQLAEDDAAHTTARSLEPGSVRRMGAMVLRRLVAEACGTGPSLDPLAHQLARAWGVPRPEVLDAALVLCADHGLNVSTFTARCVASAGASIPMVVSAGLGALSGRRHGGHTHRVAAMLDTPGPIARVLARKLERDGVVPGFDHPLYPQGDPRARGLLGMGPRGSAARRSARFETVARDELGILPNLDFGLVTLCRSVGAPAFAPWALFAIGRTAGWVAHALEQYASGALIRPRAEYVGPKPGI